MKGAIKVESFTDKGGNEVKMHTSAAILAPTGGFAVSDDSKKSTYIGFCCCS